MEVTKTYVEFYYPGSFFSETDSKEVASRNPKIKIPEGVFGFRFYDQTSKQTKIDGENKTIYGKQKNLSGMYYPGGEVFTLEQIEKMEGQGSILASNMRGNNWLKVVQTRRGNFQPFNLKDEVI